MHVAPRYVMRAQIILSRSDLEEALYRLTPFELHLDADEEKVLTFHPPWQVQLVPGVGLRAETDMRIKWPILGMEIPFRVITASLLVIPEIVSLDGRDALAFSFRVESADLKMIPTFIDERVVDKANEALSSDRARLTWKFLDSLVLRLPLPSQLRAPTPTIDIHPRCGNLEVTDEEVSFEVLFDVAPEELSLDDSIEEELPAAEQPLHH